jgi:hypothetical protein
MEGKIFFILVYSCLDLHTLFPVGRQSPKKFILVPNYELGVVGYWGGGGCIDAS